MMTIFACQTNKNSENLDTKTPNILIVMTDDQGYSDIGFNGNPYVKTPFIDGFAEKSIIFDRFYTYPICSPSRAALMTGRYPFRAAITRTAEGRSNLRPEAVTIAEILKEQGYKTGLFGKWHLGDHMPSRPQDQGFDTVVTHVGGMIGAPYSPRNGESYFDPVLLENGTEKRFQGYCADIFTNAAIEFMSNTKSPFFTFLSLNTPHHPLTVSDSYAKPYLDMGLSNDTARFYGMITNIDDNFQKVINRLEKNGDLSNTLVVFLSDNGTSSLHKQEDLWSIGMKGRKTYVYENGIRVPMFVRFPTTMNAKRVSNIASINDIVPTILDVCGIENTDVLFDGFSLRDVLIETDEAKSRNLFTQCHGGEEAVTPYRNIAVHSGDFKLVQSKGRGITQFDEDDMNFEIYNISKDQNEENNLSVDQNPLVQHLKNEYDNWLKEVSVKGYAPIRTYIGASENPVELTRQDWFGAGLFDGDLGTYCLHSKSKGFYNITCTWSEIVKKPHKVYLKINDVLYTKELLYAESSVLFENIKI